MKVKGAITSSIISSQLTGKKSSKDSNEPEPLSNKRSWADTLFNSALSFFPGKDEWRKRLIYSMFEWFDKPEHLLIEQFYLHHKIPRSTFYEWRDLYPDLKQALEDVKIFIGAKRRLGAMTFKLHYASAYRDMHCYDSEWAKSVDEYHSKLKAFEKDDGSSSGTQYIVVNTTGKKLNE
jgi:hypothetical protein